MRIIIEDVNDTPPQFIGKDNWNFYIDEDEEGTTFAARELLQTVRVTDPDTEQKFTFRLEYGLFLLHARHTHVNLRGFSEATLHLMVSSRLSRLQPMGKPC